MKGAVFAQNKRPRVGGRLMECRTLTADHRAVTPGLLPALGAELLEGRWVTTLDANRERPVVLVDEMLANRHWPDSSSIGRRLNVQVYDDGSFVSTWAEIVGVVSHVRQHGLTEDVREQVYLPHAIASRPELAFALRAEGDPSALVAPVRRELAGLDGRLPLSNIRLMSDYVVQARSASRMTAILAGLFALVAMALAGIGIYGVIAFTVNHQVKELGLRLALGAGRGDILKLVFGQGLRLVILGLLLGLAGAISLSHLLTTVLYGVQPLDPLTFLLTSLGILSVALLAIALPAHRASVVDPMQVLRCE